VIDLHSHLLPGVDDGARSVPQAVTTLEQMVRHGIDTVCLTPHLNASRATQGVPVAHDEAFRRLEPAVPPGLRLLRGVELMLDRPFPMEAAENPHLRLGNSRRILVEFPTGVAPSAAQNALSRVAQAGLVPVLAHPERYSCCTPAVAATWKAVGAVLQLDATTLFRPRSRGERARALLAEGLADILAADNHGDDRLLSTAYTALGELGGVEQATLLTQVNPAAILADQVTQPVPPFSLRQPLLARLRQFFKPEE
jgi:protein-tyrosine phosphatase